MKRSEKRESNLFVRVRLCHFLCFAADQKCGKNKKVVSSGSLVFFCKHLFAVSL